MKRFSSFLILVLLIVSIFGCAKTRTCNEPKNKWFDSYQNNKDLFRTHKGEPLSNSILRSVIKAGDKPSKILALSGGGQNGAYGAGFLKGLMERSDSSGLKFNIVTGISTGALMATHAYIGSKDKIKELEEKYTTIEQKDIYRTRSIFELLYESSLYDTTPLRNMINTFIDDKIIISVAKIYEKENRNLYIGTVDLDKGRFITWDMGEIAKEAHNGNQEAFKLYRDVIMASAAPSVFFPPVLLKTTNSKGKTYEGLHVDGAVRKNVFLPRLLKSFIAAVDKAKKKAGAEIKIPDLEEATMNVIVNKKMGIGYECTKECIKDVGLRSIEVLLDEANLSAVFRTYAIACANKIKFQMTSIPNNMEIGDNALKFNPDTMKKLSKRGYIIATSDPNPWDPKPPSGEDLDGLCP